MLGWLTVRVGYWGKMLFILLLLPMGLLVGCNDDDSNDESMIFLSVEEFGSSSFVRFHASSSLIGVGKSLVSLNYTIAVVDTDEHIHTQDSDSLAEHHVVVLDAGTYDITVTAVIASEESVAENSERLESDTDTLTQTYTIVVDEAHEYAVLELGSDENCKIHCSNNLDGNYEKSFCYTELDEDSCDYNAIPIEDLLQTAKDTQSNLENVDSDELWVCLRATGAPGTVGTAQGGYTAGGAGYGGVAQTVMNYSDLLEATDEVDDLHYLYFLIGMGGAATIVSTSDFSSDTSWGDVDLALIGGGGGSGGDGLDLTSYNEENGTNNTSYSGGDGGQGGVVSVYSYSSSTDKCAFAAGSNGVASYANDGGYYFEYGGGGGGSDTVTDEQTLVDCSDGYATAGTTDFNYASYIATNNSRNDGLNNGHAGFGGLISISPNATNTDTATYATWYNDSDFSTDYGENFLHSGNGSTGLAEFSAYGGNGGGGAGGGAGGAYSSGGGGGGSMARSYLSSSSVSATSWCELDTHFSDEGSSTIGMVQVIFYTGD